MNNDLPLRNLETVTENTSRTSSEILKIIDLNGKVTKPGPLPAPCSGYSGKAYRTSHPWSVYDVPVPRMREAMDRLRRDLPKKGWKIVKDGPDRSPSKSPEIVANSKGDEFSVNIRLLAERDDSPHTSLIEVTVESACFRTENSD
ncbi:hypothetical protein [Streptomyces sp. NPDC048612]|uniref:hypothetical protein n=1 Tax=Streptomyces sp. NPDC048612 TaxID=3365579 RepID=UPI00371B35CD